MTSDINEKQLVTRVIEPGTSFTGRIRDLLAYRELIVNLTRKELRVKYKSSVLGFVWSMLNPLLYLGIFWLVFTYFLPNNIPNFAIYLVSGLLGWNLFSAGLSNSVSSLLSNASLVTKVYFPREVLPMSALGAALMHFFFQLIVVAGVLAAFRYPVGPAVLLLVPAALVVELIVLAGFCLIVAVLNVYFRDVQHLLELLLLAWFWMTPIVYPVATLQSSIGRFWTLSLLNPMTAIELAFQRGIYTHVRPLHNGIPVQVLVDAPITWYLRNLAFVAVGGFIMFLVGWAIFRRLESRLAEEL
jgi:ABC-2 type transport system permease protein